MSVVGSVVVNFASATAGYFAGSKAVQDDVSTLESVFGGIGGKLAGVFAGIGAGLSAGAIVSGLKSAGEAIVDLAHDADRLSISTQQLSALRFAAREAGVDSEGLSKAMLKMQATVGKAAVEGGSAATTLEKFGFNAKALANEDPGKAFSDIANQIQSIHNPAERAAAEVAIFGKSGAQLKPLLEQGAQGLTKAAEEADKLGVTMSAMDSANVLRASQSMEKISESATGIGQHIAADLAPYVEDVANRMLKWAEEGDHVGKIVRGAMTGISYTVAGVMTVFDLLKGAVEIDAAIMVGQFAVLATSLQVVADAGAWLINKVFGSHISTEGIDSAADNLRHKAVQLAKDGASSMGDVFTGNSGAKVFEYFDGIKAKADAVSKDSIKSQSGIVAQMGDDVSGSAEKIQQKLDELHKSVDTFGQSDGFKKLTDLKSIGASDGQLKEAEALAKQLDVMKEQAKVQENLNKLRLEAAQAGMTEAQKQADNLKRMGGSDKDVAEAAALAKQIDQGKQQLAIAKQLDELRKQDRQTGMSEAGKKVDDLQAMGASAAQIAEATKLQAHIEEVNKAKTEAKELDDLAKKAHEDALTPMQREQEEIAKLQKLYETGRITKEEFASASAKATGKVAGNEDRDSHKAVTRGSQEAFALINQINQRMHGGDQHTRIATAQLKAQEKSAQYLAQLVKPKGSKPQAARLSLV